MIEKRSSHDHKDGCTFCELPAKHRLDLGVTSFYGNFDKYPVSPGHMEVIPQRHVVDLLDLTKDEWGELQTGIQNGVQLIEQTDLTVVYKKIIADPLDDNSVWFAEKALEHPRIKTKPDAYNHGVNDGKAAGRTVNHLHWHIMPRYEGDVVDPRGGVRYVIPKYGNYKLPRNK